MCIITITSDWNDDDYYVASLKGKILSASPKARIFDISHKVAPFNTSQAAFIIRNSFKHFPKGSIHLIAVNTEPEESGHLLAARVAGHYFLCADNGLLGLLGEEGEHEVVSLEKPAAHSSFLALSVFANAASCLEKGSKLAELGTVVKDYDRRVPLRPTIEENTIVGSIIHLDSYQNAISNISRDFFERLREDRPYKIFIQSKHYVLEEINSSYREAAEGEYLAIWNSLDLLEIAVRNGNAAGLLNLRTGSTIRVEFNDEGNA